MMFITLFEVVHVENDSCCWKYYRTFGKRHSNVHTQLPHPHTHGLQLAANWCTHHVMVHRVMEAASPEQAQRHRWWSNPCTRRRSPSAPLEPEERGGSKNQQLAPKQLCHEKSGCWIRWASQIPWSNTRTPTRVRFPSFEAAGKHFVCTHCAPKEIWYTLNLAPAAPCSPRGHNHLHMETTVYILERRIHTTKQV